MLLNLAVTDLTKKKKNLPFFFNIWFIRILRPFETYLLNGFDFFIIIRHLPIASSLYLVNQLFVRVGETLRWKKVRLWAKAYGKSNKWWERFHDSSRILHWTSLWKGYRINWFYAWNIEGIFPKLLIVKYFFAFILSFIHIPFLHRRKKNLLSHNLCLLFFFSNGTWMRHKKWDRRETPSLFYFSIFFFFLWAGQWWMDDIEWHYFSLYSI